MKQFWIRIWAFYTKHTLVRHAVTGLTAVIVVESAPILTEWATQIFSTQTVEAAAIGIIGAAVRWGQIRLEVLVAELTVPSPS